MVNIYFYATETPKGLERYSDFFKTKELAEEWHASFLKKCFKYTGRILTLQTQRRKYE